MFYSSSMMPLLRVSFMLRCFQHLSRTAWLPSKCPVGQLVNQRLQAPVPLVRGGLFLQASTLPARSNQPVSRRSKPISRSALIGEQPHPWQLLHRQDAERRHRSSKPSGRCGLLLKTTQLSLG